MPKDSGPEVVLRLSTGQKHPTPPVRSKMTAEEVKRLRIGASAILERASVPHLLLTQTVTKGGHVHVGFSYQAIGKDGLRSLCEDLRELLHVIDPDLRDDEVEH